jgi:hypothetical protein
MTTKVAVRRQMVNKYSSLVPPIKTNEKFLIMGNSTPVLTELVHKLEHLLKYSYRASGGHVLKYPLHSVTVKSNLEFSRSTFYVTCG